MLYETILLFITIRPFSLVFLCSIVLCWLRHQCYYKQFQNDTVVFVSNAFAIAVAPSHQCY